MDDQQRVLRSASELTERLNDLLVQRENLIREGERVGIKSLDLDAAFPVVSGRPALAVAREERDKIKAQQFEATAELWKFGQVIEDRYGLRWRADLNMIRDERGWYCRSVGLRVFLSGKMMAGRGPLKKIRVDYVGGDQARAAREAGEVEDHAVVVEPIEDEDPPT